MNIKLLFSLALALIVVSFPLWAHGQSLGSKSGNLGQKVGQSKLSANKQAGPNNTAGMSVNPNSGRNNGPGNNFNKTHNNRRDSGGNKDNWHGGKDKWHGKHDDHKWRHKFNPLYAPYYYLGYYGYPPYTGYYAYIDPDYPFGYGTTLGTTLERPSNLEVNQFLEGAPAPQDYRQDDSGAGDAYTEPPQDAVVEYYNPSPSGEQTIYVWVDEGGVRNYANDIDLVPERYRDIVTIVGAE
ncbi:MAG: hypothetical protein AB1598_13490 [Thermodesulfobacteriota bacterium]